MYEYQVYCTESRSKWVTVKARSEFEAEELAREQIGSIGGEKFFEDCKPTIGFRPSMTPRLSR